MDTKKKTPPPVSNASIADVDVSPEERALLARSERNPPDEDELAIQEASLDETDEDGTPLEEQGLDQDLTGSDLDIPGAEEGIGDEDEDDND